MIRAGKLRHRVTVQRIDPTLGEMGDRSDTWTNLTTRWASIEPAGSREEEVARQLDARITHRIRMRYCSVLTHADRLLFKGRTFEIRQLTNYAELGKETIVLAEERTS